MAGVRTLHRPATGMIAVMVAPGAEVAVTTLALAQCLRQAVAVVPAAVVASQLPRRASIAAPPPSVGLWMFHAGSRAAAQPPRRPAEPAGERTSTLALDYVIYVGGDSTRCVPEILLGLVIDALETTPIIDSAEGVAAFQTMHPDLPLPGGIDRIRVSRLALSGIDRAALWSMMGTPYQLSIEYRAEVLTI
jgi:hypothetical protein